MALDVDSRYAPRLKAVRETRGLTREELAVQAGLRKDFLWDVEAYPDELVLAVSLRELAAVCRVLGVQPAALFAADGTTPLAPIRPAELAGAIEARMRAAGLTAEEFGERAGWDVTGLLADPPTAVAALNVDGLHDICEAAGVPWLAALPINAPDVGA